MGEAEFLNRSYKNMLDVSSPTPVKRFSVVMLTSIFIGYYAIGVLFILSFCSCAHYPRTPVVPPSTKPVQTQIDSAASSNKAGQKHSVSARTLAERIEAKDAVIDKYHRDHP